MLYRSLLAIAALLLSDALLLVGHGLLLTLLPVAGAAAGFTNSQVALTGSAYFVGFVLGCLVSPWVVRRVGHIRSFAILATLYSAVAIGFPLLPVFLSWLLLRLLSGAAIAGLYMIIESWLNERADSEVRGMVLSTYTVINLLMIMAGQQLINLGEIGSYELFAWAAILLSLAILPVSLTLSLQPAPLTSIRLDLRKVWRQSHVALNGTVAAGLVTGAFWSIGPVYASRVGLETRELTLFMTAVVLGGALFQLPLGRLSDRFDRRGVLLYSALAGAAASALLVVLPGLLPGPGYRLHIGLAFLWGGTVMTLYPICLAHANDRAAAEDFVMVGTGMLLVLGLCSAIGGPLATVAMHYMGPPGLFAFTALCLLVFAGYTSMRRRLHALARLTRISAFRAVTTLASPGSLELDPRAAGESPGEDTGAGTAGNAAQDTPPTGEPAPEAGAAPGVPEADAARRDSADPARPADGETPPQR